MLHRIIFVASLTMTNVAVAAPATAISTLVSAMNHRLLLMRDVAENKAQQHLAVEDLHREQNVVTLAKNDAVKAGLDPHSIVPFIQAQMDVAKAIQHRYMADWLSNPEGRHKAKSLEEVRTEISRQDAIIFEALGDRLRTGHFSETDHADVINLLSGEHLTFADKNHIASALLVLRKK